MWLLKQVFTSTKLKLYLKKYPSKKIQKNFSIHLVSRKVFLKSHSPMKMIYQAWFKIINEILMLKKLIVFYVPVVKPLQDFKKKCSKVFSNHLYALVKNNFSNDSNDPVSVLEDNQARLNKYFTLLETLISQIFLYIIHF